MPLTPELLEETTRRYRERAVRRAEVAEAATNPVLGANPLVDIRRRVERISAESLRIADAGPADGRRVGLNVFERLIGKDDLLPVSYLELGVRASHAIARIQVRNARGQISSLGTGFLVSPRLLMTNNHVLDDAAAASRSIAEFGYDDQRIPGSTLLLELDVDAFFFTSRALDFTVVALKEPASGSLDDLGWIRMISGVPGVLIGESVSIIQHADGRPKEVAIRENQVVDLLDDFLHYQTDTASGSSGAPVFNDEWTMVALHHSGVPGRNDRGEILSVDGGVWTEDMGERRVKWVANEGVRSDRILDALSGIELSPPQAELRDQLLELQKQPASTPTGGTGTVASNDEEPTSGSPEPVVRTLAWKVPLEVRVEVTVDPRSGEGRISGELEVRVGETTPVPE